MKRTNILIIGILTIFAAALVATPVAADISVTYFEGIVIDQNGDPVDGATVVLEYAGPDFHGSMQIDSGSEMGPGTWWLYPYIGINYTLYAYIADTPYESQHITGTANESMWNGITLVLSDGEGDDWTDLEGYVIDQNENPIEGAIVYLEYGNGDDIYEEDETESDDDGYFSFDVPVGVGFYLYAYIVESDLESNEIEGVTTDEMGDKILVINMGSPRTATAYGKVFDSSNYPVDGATVYLVYEDEEEEYVILTTVSEEGGYYTFSNLPWEIVYAVNATYGDLRSEREDGTTGSGGSNNVFLYLNGAVYTPSPTPVPVYTGYNGPWTLINTEWYYNDTNPFPATAAVPTPVSTPVPTQAPATGGSGTGGIATATPTPTPTPTPVPVSSENTNFVTDNLWWLLLAILIVAVIGTWYVTRQK